MLAVAGGHVDAVSLLLEREANVNVADKKGLTALHLGVRLPELRGQLEVCAAVCDRMSLCSFCALRTSVSSVCWSRRRRCCRGTRRVEPPSTWLQPKATPPG